MKKPKAPKKLSYRLIERESLAGATLYPLVDELIRAHHEHLREARVGLCWNLSWKPDVDGRVTLGKCKLASELDRELAAFDLVIILRQAFFEDGRVTTDQRRALIDHELMHAALKYDETGEPSIDERGRRVYRTRKHDLEEFAEIAERYGCWKRDIEAFAAAIDRARAKSTTWPGFAGLRDKLVAAGATVPLDAILAWTTEERREAEVWARVQVDIKKRGLEIKISADCPSHIRKAVYQPPERPAQGETPSASSIGTSVGGETFH